jgi:hypothetical protein
MKLMNSSNSDPHYDKKFLSTYASFSHHNSMIGSKMRLYVPVRPGRRDSDEFSDEE